MNITKVIMLGSTLLLLYSVTFVPIAETKESGKRIIRMECVMESWDSIHRNSQSPTSILAHKNTYDRVTIYQELYLRDLLQQIKQLRPTTEIAHLDVRVVCLLYTDKKTIDTLSFSGFGYCQYNDKCYYLTWTFLQTIMKKLPHEQVAIIEWLLETLPEAKEQLIANDKK